MPVKVRCPGCRKVVNAPEKARGKAVRCPDCQTIVRVPAERQVAQRAAAPPPSSSAIIANLDLNRLTDAENRICPRCGADVSPDDIECPKCEVMLETGQLSDQKKAARSRKGPDPKLFYSSMIKDAWQFGMGQKKLAARTCTYAVISSMISLGCFLMVLWCTRLPPKAFWGLWGVVALLVVPGWAWHLHTVIIDSALAKKTRLPKRILFDFFLCSALGVKLIAWTLAMGLPLHAAAIVFWMFEMQIVAASFAGAGLLFAVLVFPIAMVHMTMPVTFPAWQFWKMDLLFLRTALPSLYWVFFLCLTMLPALGVVGAGAAISQSGMNDLFQTLQDNAKIDAAIVRKAEHEAKAGKKDAQIARLDDETKEWAEKTPFEVDWTVTIIPSVCWVLASALFGFASVFNMRSNGLFAVYFRDRLDLISMADEIKYVPKPVDADGLRKSAADSRFGFWPLRIATILIIVTIDVLLILAMIFKW